MANSNYTSISSDHFTLTSRTTSSTATVTVWAIIYQYIQMYVVPIVVANALVGNTVIILLTLTTNFFSLQTSFTVRFYYMTIAFADLVTVLSYNLISWLGVHMRPMKTLTEGASL